MKYVLVCLFVGVLLDSGWSRIRAMKVRFHTMTMPEFLEARYDSRGFKLFSALVIFVFSVTYSPSLYTGMLYIYATLAMCFVTALYLVLGRYRAVAMTNMV